MSDDNLGHDFSGFGHHGGYCVRCGDLEGAPKHRECPGENEVREPSEFTGRRVTSDFFGANSAQVMRWIEEEGSVAIVDDGGEIRAVISIPRADLRADLFDDFDLDGE